MCLSHGFFYIHIVSPAQQFAGLIMVLPQGCGQHDRRRISDVVYGLSIAYVYDLGLDTKSFEAV